MPGIRSAVLWLCRVAPLVLLAAAAPSLDIMAELDRALAPAPPVADTAAASSPAAPSAPPGALSQGMLPSVRVRVSSARHTVLSTQGTGRIEEVRVRDGERFREGDLLVRMDDTLARHHLRRAAAAHRRHDVLHRMTLELAGLGTRGEAELDVVKADLEQAAAELAVAEEMLARTRVTAPFSGRVADVFAREMQYLPEGQPLLEILDDGELELEFIVSSHWLPWFKPGYRFSVTLEETGRDYRAELARIGGKVDPLSQSVKAYATLLDADPELMEGMSGAARIVPPEGW